VLGLRPEHIIETRPHMEPNQHDFDNLIDVVERWAWRRWVYFTMRVSRSAAGSTPTPGATARQGHELRADLSNMHLIDDGTGRVPFIDRGHTARCQVQESRNIDGFVDGKVAWVTVLARVLVRRRRSRSPGRRPRWC